MKILLQRLWENNLEWDEPVPTQIERTWKKWHRELPALRNHQIMRPYFPKEIEVVNKELHGFCDASEAAYSGVIHLRAVDTKGDVHVSLVIAKTKVAPLKRLSIPRLELCSAVLLSNLLGHVADTLEIPSQNIYAWTDSQVVLGWLRGNPRRFKPFVGNRIAELSEVIPVGCWHHVPGVDNPADCASRGMFPSQLAQFELWWYGPPWLKNNVKGWGPPSSKIEFPEHPIPSEERELPEMAFVALSTDLSLIERTSSYDRLIRITAWMFRFVRHCRKRDKQTSHSTLAVHELDHAEEFWCCTVQSLAFQEDITYLKMKGAFRQSSKLLKFHPFLDSKGLLRAGGRISEARVPYAKRHPILLPGNHVFTELLIASEHRRLLHAGATLVSASLSRKFCILNGRRTIRSIIQRCVKCRKVAAKPKPQIFGQLPADRINPGPVFNCVGIDYAGPLLIKSGPVRKPVLKKSYVAVFVCFATKAVHLELVSELTTAAFIATLRRFIGRRGIPRTIWSDHGSNFIGAEREIQQLLREGGSKQVADFCASQKINWTFSPEHAPHFGGLWEAAVKSFKTHIKIVLGEVKLNFEEFSTVLVQVEACLNSRPLTPLPDHSDALEVLTPGHFLIGRPLAALPDEVSHEKVTHLRRWQLCQALVRHLWARWSSEYLRSLWKISKWHKPSENLQEGDIVCLREEPLAPTKWPLARIVQVHPGKDGKVRVVTVRTAKGVYRRPVIKVVPLVCPER